VTAAILGKYWRHAYCCSLSPDTVPHRIAYPFTCRPPFFLYSSVALVLAEIDRTLVP
jgi:hypothetical protein